jgi:hypothetical protein
MITQETIDTLAGTWVDLASSAPFRPPQDTWELEYTWSEDCVSSCTCSYKYKVLADNASRLIHHASRFHRKVTQSSQEKEVIRVRKGSYNSLMHAVHRECAKEKIARRICILPERQERKTDSERNAGFQPISIPLVSCHGHLIPRPKSPRVIVNKLLRKSRNIQKNREKTKRLHTIQKSRRKITKSTP